jgi:hypothetical protein
MNTPAAIGLIGFAFFSLVATSHAQILVSWGKIVALSDDSDIQTNGSYFDAVNTTQEGGHYTTTAVGSTTFNALTNVVGGTPGQDGTDGIITIHSDGGNYGNVPGATGSFGFTGGSTAYQTILDQASDANNGSVTIGSVTDPLTSGDTYQIQVFAYYPGPYAAKVDGSPSISFTNYSGGYSIGTFVADAPTETFSYSGIDNNSGHAGFVDDVAVRNLGVIPEPGAWAMLLGGLGLLVLVGRCRRQVALQG